MRTIIRLLVHIAQLLHRIEYELECQRYESPQYSGDKCEECREE